MYSNHITIARGFVFLGGGMNGNAVRCRSARAKKKTKKTGHSFKRYKYTQNNHRMPKKKKHEMNYRTNYLGMAHTSDDLLGSQMPIKHRNLRN